MVDQKIQLGPVPQHPEDNLRRQGRIARIQLRRVRQQQVRSPSPAFHPAQDVERESTGGSRHCPSVPSLPQRHRRIYAGRPRRRNQRRQNGHHRHYRRGGGQRFRICRPHAV
jgi:hypothetical protein